ncbi:Fe(2+) transporter permease subunit FeoB [Sutterella sp.]|uniref:Fe(2+) transporter permease subunit FeoB n=1 Tax=Sutterella sp. TaxID=1981025 RepID=UPI0026E0D4D5|nr:Fe(2+) transporter permease subunit FeoB [Sutterella sp.]MDO5532935.1 Fe(2+) transporter permease subunit FeoB [Sutterella sp.]
MSQHIVCVVGNPNCGKTTFFNALTGSRQRVGNWPGVTVDKKTGTFECKGEKIELVDLPGIYSITPAASSGEDERVARDYVLSGEAQAVINIIDASNLERNLYLTAQLVEMQVPMIVVVNMLDIAKQHKMEIRLEKLQEALGCPVVGIVASRETGLDDFNEVLSRFLANPTIPPMQVEFDEDIRFAVERIAENLKAQGVERPAWFASQFMEKAPALEEKLGGVNVAEAEKIVAELDAKYDGDLDIAIANARYSFVAKVAEQAIVRLGEATATTTDKIDRVVLNRWLGLPIFLLIMYVMFLFTQNLGGCFIDFFDILVGGVFVDGLTELLTSIGCPEWLTVFIATGIGGGLQTVSTFIPPVFFLFLFLAVLEDSGYMARAAFVMDRLMRALGLPGKAFVPLIVGFGCNVPAIMATRTMDRAADRIITVLMTPFMSCGARLPVYVLFATAFWPTNGQNLVFLLYVIGIVAAILTGFLLKRAALPGVASAFVMEIPPYHIPTFKGVMLRTWDRVKTFMFRAGKVIVVIVACLSILNSLGTDGSFGNEDSENSVLSEIGRTIVPIFEPMGVQEDNWPAAVGVFTGVFAKEAVVGTLNSLYDTIAAEKAAKEEAAAAPEGEEAAAEEEEEEGWSFMAILDEAVSTTIDNLADLGSAFADPFGITVGDLSDEEAAAEEQEVTTSTIDTVRDLFGSSSAAFAYLLMVLLYMPCCAAIAAVWREVGTAWTIFSGTWCCVLGYTSAVIFYRAVNFSAAPAYSGICIVVSIAALVGMYLWMKSFAKKDSEGAPKVIPIQSAR